jgi:carotenoid cleavage dioxygenase-like enzyme
LAPFRQIKKAPLVRRSYAKVVAIIEDEDGCFPGEPVFLPRPNGADHLEGVIVSVVLDGKRDRSFMLVLDAQSFEEVGRAFAPHVIPFGFHGEFKS